MVELVVGARQGAELSGTPIQVDVTRAKGWEEAHVRRCRRKYSDSYVSLCSSCKDKLMHLSNVFRCSWSFHTLSRWCVAALSLCIYFKSAVKQTGWINMYWMCPTTITKVQMTLLPSISPPDEDILLRFKNVVPMASSLLTRSLRKRRCWSGICLFCM